ncbi:MAG: hypothetical protein R3F17_11435 [Planctomycetota bacterium]
MVPQAFLYPLLAALALALVGWLRSPAQGKPRAWCAALAWGAALALAWLPLKGGLAPWPPKEATHWLFYGSLLAIPIAALQGWRASLPHFLLGSLLIAAWIWFACEPLRVHEWKNADQWQQPALLLGLGMAALLLNSDLVRCRARGIEVSGAAGLTLGAAAYVLGQSTGASAHLIGGLACVAAVWCALSVWRRDASVHHGSSLPFTLVLGGLLVIGVYFARTSPRSALLLLFAPQAIRLGWPLRHYPKVAFVVSVLACAAVCGLAAWWGYEKPDPYGAW